MGWDAPWHWVVLAIIVIALFGYKKLPDASRALGRSLRIFKTEIKGMGEDDKTREAAKAAPDTAQPQPPATPAAQEPPGGATNGVAPAAPAAAATPAGEKPAARPAE